MLFENSTNLISFCFLNEENNQSAEQTLDKHEQIYLKLLFGINGAWACHRLPSYGVLLLAHIHLGRNTGNPLLTNACLATFKVTTAL